MHNQWLITAVRLVATVVMITGFALGSANAAQNHYAATLTGAAESPPNASPATGRALITVDTVAQTMRVQASFSGLSGTTNTAHIHCCTVASSTGIVGVATTTPTFAGFPLGVTSGTYDQTLDMTQASSYNSWFFTANGGTTATAGAALFAGLAAGKAYFNIHTASFGGGEIRGFPVLVPPATHFSVSAPASAIGANAFSVTVSALDASNAVDTAYVGTVHFSSSDSLVTLPANSALTNGVGTFSVTLRTVGHQTVSATDTVTSSITGTSSTIAVAPELTGTPYNFSAIQGVAYSNGSVGTFTSARGGSLSSDFTASINWGDGTTTAGTITLNAATFTVSGTHTYAASGSFTVTVSITDTTNSATASITDTAIVANAQAVSLNPTSLTFTSQNVGTTSTAKTVTLTNTGTAPLTISSIVSNNGVFNLTNNCSSTIAGGANCTFGVSFTPISPVNSVSSVTVTSNAAGSPHSVVLNGTGVPAGAPICTLTASPATVAANGTSVLTSSCTNSPTSYSWTGGTCGGTTGTTCTVTPTATTSYSVTGTNNFGYSTASANVTVISGDITPILFLLLFD